MDLFGGSPEQGESHLRRILVKLSQRERQYEFDTSFSQLQVDFLRMLLANGARTLTHYTATDIYEELTPVLEQWTHSLLNTLLNFWISAKKSLFAAYVLWFLSGLCGLPLHLLYLGRPVHAFVWLSTRGGLSGLGWLYDAYNIQRMVDEANGCSTLPHDNLAYPDDVDGVSRIVISIAVGFIWGIWALREGLHWGIPICVGLGVWAFGNIGHQSRGYPFLCILAALVSYPCRFVLREDGLAWLFATSACSTLAFEFWSRKAVVVTPTRTEGTYRDDLPMFLSIFVHFVCLTQDVRNFVSGPWFFDSMTIIRAIGYLLEN